jgi:hypothetical protein
MFLPAVETHDKAPASSSSMRTVADPARAFGSRQSRGGENRRRFCETNPIFRALQVTSIREQRKASKLPPASRLSTRMAEAVGVDSVCGDERCGPRQEALREDDRYSLNSDRPF